MKQALSLATTDDSEPHSITQYPVTRDYSYCQNCSSEPYYFHDEVCLSFFEGLPESQQGIYEVPRLSAAERRIVDAAIEAMRHKPSSVDMGDWMSHDEDVKPKRDDPENYCGTVACMAGHIALAAGCPPVENVSMYDRRNKRGYAKRKGLHGHVSSIATEILHLEGDTDRLYLADEWPEPFKTQYKQARSPRGRAGATIRRLRHYTKTGE